MAENYSYKTFDDAYAVIADKTYNPRTLEEAVKIIKDNYEGDKKTIRVSGGHHTFNDISITKDIIIRTRNLHKVLNLDKENKQVTVQSGMILLELNNYLQKNNLAVSVLPAIPWQTVAGALSTSTHGSCAHFGSMASLLVDMTLVLANGKIKKIYRDDPEFEALSPNLGCLGFIYSVTLQCEDLFAIDHRRVTMKISEFLDNFKELQKKYQYLQAYMWPFSKGQTCSVYLRKKIGAATVEEEQQQQSNKDHKIDFSSNILTKNNEEVSYYTEMEIAVPVDHVKEAVNKAIQLYKKYKDKYNYSSDYSILVRFTKPDKRSLLSMAADRDTAFIDMFNKAEYHDNKYLNMLFKEFHDYVVDKFKARPHYGKKHYLTHKQMLHIYGDRINKFNKIKKRLDPDGIFSNDYVIRLIRG
jgi:FAD/FMN-containing dehydrogenase